MNKRKIIRQSFAITLGLVGLWLFQLTLPSFPSGRETLEKLVNHPLFLEKAIGLPLAEEENKLSFWTNMVVNHYSFLRFEEVLPEEAPEQEEIPLPKIPEESIDPPTGDWETTTMKGQESFLEKDGLYVANNGKVVLSEDDFLESESFTLEKHQEAPQILIYHSHGTESYTQTEGYTYEESDPYRTLNMDLNITAVGATMAEIFEAAGYGVIHDKTLHDYPDYNSSYTNSGLMLAKYIEEYPSLTLILDVHRDALATETGVPYQLISEDQGGDVAQVMLVVGTNGGSYDHPNWEENFSLALSIQNRLLIYGDYVRPITLRTSRFNQHYSTGALLLEVGGHGNTFPQAVAGAELFAHSVVELLESNI